MSIKVVIDEQTIVDESPVALPDNNFEHGEASISLAMLRLPVDHAEIMLFLSDALTPRQSGLAKISTVKPAGDKDHDLKSGIVSNPKGVT